MLQKLLQTVASDYLSNITTDKISPTFPILPESDEINDGIMCIMYLGYLIGEEEQTKQHFLKDATELVKNGTSTSVEIRQQILKDLQDKDEYENVNGNE